MVDCLRRAIDAAIGPERQHPDGLQLRALTFNFDGNGNISDHPFAIGQLQLRARSASTLEAWVEGKPLPPAPIGAIAVNTNVTMSAQAWKMDNLSLSLDDSNATGVLGIAWNRTRGPRIDGTLAFDQLDLAPIVSSAQTAQSSSAVPLDRTLLKQFSLDLRLSAQEVSYGTAALTDVAAGVMVENGRASIDIGDGTFAGGTISGRIALAGSDTEGGQMQFTLKNADLTPVAASLGLTGPLPLGRGVLSVDLLADRPLQTLTKDGISGEIRYSANDGSVANFDMPEFERLAAQGRAFSISHATNGSFAFTRADIVATLRTGVAELTTADITSEGRTLSLAGTIPVGSGTLALVGAIRTGGDTTPATRFFVDGSWPNPLISPLPASAAQP